MAAYTHDIFLKWNSTVALCYSPLQILLIQLLSSNIQEKVILLKVKSVNVLLWFTHKNFVVISFSIYPDFFEFQEWFFLIFSLSTQHIMGNQLIPCTLALPLKMPRVFSILLRKSLHGIYVISCYLTCIQSLSFI